jgi:RHH-type proline utilization regulon transcriptional repressor/proline dehydrogenase/delta 1-pyrroline-5-carboxylate dehydrogenase
MQEMVRSAIQTDPELESDAVKSAGELSFDDIQAALSALPESNQNMLSALDLPGPTGESNRWSTHARGTVLCLGESREAALAQAYLASTLGCSVLVIHEGTSQDLSALSSLDSSEGNGEVSVLTGTMNLADLSRLDGIDVVAFTADVDTLRVAREALAARTGALVPLVTNEKELPSRCILERHVCIDTTAAGGNASLLAATDS